MKHIIASLLCALLVVPCFSETPQEIAKALFPKTVMISTQDKNGSPLAVGSGFIIKPGYIVTNFHVIEGASSARAKIIGDSKMHSVDGLLASDAFRDLALLAFDETTTDGVTLSQRPNIDVGETVYAIGNPLGLEGTFSQGIVSGLRDLDDFRLLQITAPISPGSSGGPIIDEDGEVIGVAFATFRDGQNVNFAIPCEYLIDLLEEVNSPVALSSLINSTSSRSVISALEGGRLTDGVTVSNFLWDKYSSRFTVSAKNNLDQDIKNVRIWVIFYDESGNIIDMAGVAPEYDWETIPAGLARRMDGQVDESVKRLTSRIEGKYGTTLADKPSTKVEYRVIGFEFWD